MPRVNRPARRTFIVLAALIAAVPARLFAAEPAAYFPDDTVLIVSFNVRQLLDATLVRENAATRSAVGEASKALENMGIASKDLDRVVLAVGEQLRSATSVALLIGRFDAERVRDRLKERARERRGEIEAVESAGGTIFECRLPRPSTPNPRITLPDRFLLTVVDGNTVAIALDRGALAAILAKKTGGRKTNLKPRLLELVARIEPKESLSVVFVPTAGLVSGGPASGLIDLTGGISVGDVISAQLRCEARDAESTRLLADSARDGLAKVREILPGLAAIQLGLGNGGQDAIREMVDSFKVTSRENSVIVTGLVTKEMIDKAGRK